MSELFDQVLALEQVQNAHYHPKSSVTELYDYEQLGVPEDTRPDEPSPAEIAKMVEALRNKYVGFEAAETVKKGDSVKCKVVSECAYSGRTILLYPGIFLPGAEAAEKEVKGKQVGDSFSCELCGNSITLEVTAITRPNDEVDDDEIVIKENIPVVETMQQYKLWCAEKIKGDKHHAAARKLAGYWFTELIKNSTFSIDPEEKDAWLTERVETSFDGELKRGNPQAVELQQDPEKKRAFIEGLKAEQAHCFEEYLAYYAICNNAGRHIGPEEAAHIITDSAAAMGLNGIEQVIPFINMRYLLEVSYLNSTLELITEKASAHLN